jgi:hypothetical protein
MGYGNIYFGWPNRAVYCIIRLRGAPPSGEGRITKHEGPVNRGNNERRPYTGRPLLGELKRGTLLRHGDYKCSVQFWELSRDARRKTHLMATLRICPNVSSATST